MKNVFDIAFYILDKCGPMSAMKLQKLVYYSQAWSLVWDDKALFKEKIEAWANGPVVPKLYDVHRGMFTVNKLNVAEKTTSKDLTEQQKETIDTVISAYAGKSAQWLSDQTHAEEPWCLARAGMPDNERGSLEITLASMSEYYSSL
jgi:uncharacterized phage-associated protein